MINNFRKSEIQYSKEMVDIYFGVDIEEGDSRIEKHELTPDALSVWVTFIDYNKEQTLIDLADEGFSVTGFEFSGSEIREIMNHIENKMKEVDWEHNKALVSN